MQKWSSTRRNFQQEGIAILKDENYKWNEWKLAKAIRTFPDKKRFVWTVKLLISSIDRNGSMYNQKFVRPVDKVVVLVESEDVEWWGSIPNEGGMKQEINIYHDYLERSQLCMDLAAILVDILKSWTCSCYFCYWETWGRYFCYFIIFYWLVYNLWVNYYIKC